MYNVVVFVFIPQSLVKGLQIPQNSAAWLIAGVTLWLQYRTFPTVPTTCHESVQYKNLQDSKIVAR